MTCSRFSDFPVSSTNNTNSYNITEILLKVALNTITPNPLFVPLSIFGGKFSIMSIFISVNNNVGNDLLVIIARFSTDLQLKTFYFYFIFSIFMLLFYWKKKLTKKITEIVDTIPMLIKILFSETDETNEIHILHKG